MMLDWIMFVLVTPFAVFFDLMLLAAILVVSFGKDSSEATREIKDKLTTGKFLFLLLESVALSVSWIVLFMKIFG